MDAARFDRLTRLFGSRISRRGAVAMTVATATAALTADASALPVRRTCRVVAASCLRNSQCCSEICDTRRTTPRNRRNRCVCPEGIVACAGACCAEGEVCEAGQCVEPPPCDGVICEPSAAAQWSNCLVSTTCQVILGCDLGVVNDPSPAAPVTCDTDDDCTAATFDPACGDLPGSCFCGIGRSGWDSTFDGNEPVNRPFARFDAPRCVRTNVQENSCPS